MLESMTPKTCALTQEGAGTGFFEELAKEPSEPFFSNQTATGFFCQNCIFYQPKRTSPQKRSRPCPNRQPGTTWTIPCPSRIPRNWRHSVIGIPPHHQIVVKKIGSTVDTWWVFWRHSDDHSPNKMKLDRGKTIMHHLCCKKGTAAASTSCGVWAVPPFFPSHAPLLVPG